MTPDRGAAAGPEAAWADGDSAPFVRREAAWADSHSTLFASPAWFEHWLDAFGAGQCGQWQLPDRCSYTIPYQVEVRRIGPIRIRVARGAANAYTPQFDACGPGNPTLHDLGRMMKDLRAAALVFPLVSATSKLVAAASSPRRRMAVFLDDCESAPLIDCSGSFEAYLAARRKSRRAEWLDKERRMRKAGGRLEVLAAWKEEIAPVFDELLAVEASGWKGRAGSAIGQVPEARRFFDGICRALAAAGKLRVFLLRREARIIAFKICTLHAGRLSSLKTSYLEAFAKDSPGVVLQLWVAKWCFEQPEIRLFDFLGPATQNKLVWSTHSEDLYTLYVFRPTPAGTIAWLRWSVGPRARQWYLGRMRRGRMSQPPPQIC